MDQFNFADLYRECSLNSSAEVIKLRQDAFAGSSLGDNYEKVVDLTRIYFGAAKKDTSEWFVDLFRKTDASFTAVDNAREMAVLAVCILAEEIRQGNFFPCIIPLVYSFNGNRTPIVVPRFIEFASNSLLNISKRTLFSPPKLSAVAAPNKTQFDAAVKSYTESNDINIILKVIQTNFSDLNRIVASTNETQKAYASLVNEIENLREEAEMLWWYIGGFSDDAKQPFTDLERNLGALLAAKDISELTDYRAGPSAADAILYRIVNATKKPKKELGFYEIMDTIPESYESILTCSKDISKHYDVFPINTALIKLWESGRGNWTNSFKKLTGLEKAIEVNPPTLASQFYRELLLLAQILGD